MDSIHSNQVTSRPTESLAISKELDKLSEIFIHVHATPETLAQVIKGGLAHRSSSSSTQDSILFQKIRTTLQNNFSADPRSNLNLVRQINQLHRPNQETLLMEACRAGDLEMVKLLLQDKQIDISQESADQQTALEIATQSSKPNQKILQLLLGRSRILQDSQVEAVVRVGSQETKKALIKALNRSNLLKQLDRNKGRGRAHASASTQGPKKRVKSELIQRLGASYEGTTTAPISSRPILESPVHSSGEIPSRPISQNTSSKALASLTSFEKLKFFGNMLGDKWIAGEKVLENAKSRRPMEIEGCDAQVFLEYFKEHQEELFGGLACSKELVAILTDLEKVENWVTRSNAAERLKEIGEKGGTKYFLCGWRRLQGGINFSSTVGHAAAGKLMKNKDGSYDLYLFNTGGGREFHPTINGSDNQPYGIVWRKISLEVCQNPQFWEILSCGNFGKQDSLHLYQSSQTLYHSLHGFLGIEPEGYGDPITPQRSGTCSKQCFDPLFRDIAHCSGSADYEIQYKLIKCRERVKALEEGIGTINSLDPIHRPFLAAILEEGLAEHSASIGKIIGKPSIGYVEETASLVQALAELQIGWERVNTKRNIAPTMEQVELSLQEVDRVVYIYSANPSSRIEFNEESKISQKYAGILTNFHCKLAQKGFLTGNEIAVWELAFTDLIEFAQSEYWNKPHLAAQLIDGHFLDLNQAIASRIGRPDKGEPKNLDTLNGLISSITEIHQAVFRSTGLDEGFKELWSSGLFMSGVALFHELTGKHYPWVHFSKLHVWSPNREWETSMDRLYQDYSQEKIPVWSSCQPVFNYSRYPAGVGLGREVLVKDSPEFLLAQSDEYYPALAQLEEFKPFMGVGATTKSLEKKESQIILKDSGYNPCTFSRTSSYAIDPEAISLGVRAEILQNKYSTLPESQLDALLSNRPLAPAIPLHPALMRLLEAGTDSQSNRMLLSRWLEVLQSFEATYKNDKVFQKALRIAVYNLVDPLHPSFKNGFTPIQNSNKELVRRLFRQLEEGCLSPDVEVSSLCWEIVWSLECVVKKENEEEMVKENVVHNQTEQNTTEAVSGSGAEENQEWTQQIQGIRDHFFKKLTLDQILQMTNREERRFYLANSLQNELRSASPRIAHLLEVYQHWNSTRNNDPLTTFEIKAQNLYVRQIQQVWPSLNISEKRSILEQVLRPLLNSKTIELEIDEVASFPRTILYDSINQEVLGGYEAIGGRIFLDKCIIDPSPIIKEEVIDANIERVFGNFRDLELTFSQNNSTFQLQTQSEVTFQQVEEKGKRFLEIGYTDPITREKFVSSSAASINADGLSSGLLELYSIQGKSLLLCKWNRQKMILEPQLKVEKNRIGSMSRTNPTQGCYIGTPEEKDRPLLAKFLERISSETIPVFWFKEKKLSCIQVPGGGIFDLSKIPYHCYLDGISYVCEGFSHDEEPLELLDGHSFKLTDEQTGEIYWYGSNNYRGSGEVAPFLDPLNQVEELKKVARNSTFKIPIIEGQLAPDTIEERLFLIEQAIESKAYQQAIQWAKRLFDLASFTPSDHLKMLEKWNWRMILTNPATRAIGNLLYLRFREEVSHLSAKELEGNAPLKQFFDSLSKLHAEMDTEGKDAKSKKRFLKVDRKISTAPLDLENNWFTGTNDVSREELPSLEHHQVLLKKSPRLIPLNPAATGAIPLSPESSKIPIDALLKLYSTPFTSADEDSIAATLRQSYDHYHFHYIDFEWEIVNPTNEMGANTTTPVAFRGLAGDFIRSIATRMGFELEGSKEPSLLSPYFRVKSSASEGEWTLHEISRDDPLPFPSLPSLTIKELSTDLVALELQLIQDLSPRDSLKDALVALHHEPIPSLDEACGMVLTNDLAQWRSFRDYFASRTDEELAQLHRSLLRYLDFKTQPAAPGERSYSLDDPIAPFFLLYEEKSGMQLRKDQVGNIKFLLEAIDRKDEISTRRMLQSLMGSGKSKVLTPLLLLYLQKQHNMMASYTTTKELLGPAIEGLARFLSENFGVMTHQIHASREMSYEALLVLKQQIAEAKLGKAILFTSTDTLHALHLSLPLLLLSHNGQASYDLTCQIILELELHQALILDECDSLLHPREQMSYPLGIPKPLPLLESRAATDLYLKYVSRYAHELRLPSKESHTTNLPGITHKILDDLAHDLYHQRSNPLINLWREEMVAAKLDESSILLAITHYLSDQRLSSEAEECRKKSIGACSPKDLIERGSEQLGIYQYAFGQKQGLIKSLQSPFKSSYGRSIQDKERHLVIPWSNAIPREGTQFQDGYQTLFKSCLYYLHEWSDPADTRLLVTEALKRTDNIIKRNKHSELLVALKHYGITPSMDEKQCKELTQKINQDLSQQHDLKSDAKHAHVLIGFFLDQVVPKELKLYSQQLLSTSTTLLHGSAYQLGISGTQEGASAWKDSFTSKWDTQEIPRVLEKAAKEPTTSIQIRGLSNSKEKIQAILAKLKDTSRAIIDVGGMLRGVPSREVAQALLGARAGAQGVLFYETLSSGLSELRILLESGEIEKVEDSSRKGLVQLMRSKGILSKEGSAEELFDELTLYTFYDKGHTRGSDIPQKSDAHALLLYDDLCTRTDLQQAVMRMRKYLQGQSLTWVSSSKTEESLPAGQLIAQGDKREREQDRVAYAQSLLDRLQHGVMKYLINFSIQGNSGDQSVAVAKKMSELLIDRSCDYHCFSPSLQEPVTYLNLIEEKLEKIAFLSRSLETQYQEAQTYFNSLHEEINAAVESHREELSSLALPHEEGVQEQNQESQQELSLEQIKNSTSQRSKDQDPTLYLYHFRATLGDRSSWNEQQVEIRSFLPADSSPDLLPEGLLFDRHLLLDMKTMPWDGYSYPVDAIFLYLSKEGNNKKSKSYGLAIRGNTRLFPGDENIWGSAIYDLQGNCIKYYGLSKGLVEVIPLEKRNLFDKESFSTTTQKNLLCSAILTSGNITALLGKDAVALRHYFLEWLKSGGAELRKERIDLFYRTYYHRLDRPFLEQYSKPEFLELLDYLEKEYQLLSENKA